MKRVFPQSICDKWRWMNGKMRLGKIASGTAALALLAAASPQSALSGVEGGEWEVARSGAQPARLCVADPAELAQFEHREGKCTREVVRSAGSQLTVNYKCSGGGFGHSNVTVITPRSLRIETQGIARGGPFNYVLQVRRIGNCPAH